MSRHIKRAALAGQQEAADAKIRSIVESIIANVAKRGDAAVREMSERFDKWSPPSFRLSEDEIAALLDKVAPQTIEDIKFAQTQIRISPRSRGARCAMSRSRHCRGSYSGTGTSRSAVSGAMCRAAAIPWSPRRI
jgi:histidinol dehydrogenase